jgi:hypothetical protein
MHQAISRQLVINVDIGSYLSGGIETISSTFQGKFLS